MKKTQDKVFEEVPTNNISGGKIEGAGVGPKGEPGVPRRRKKVTPFMAFVKRKN
jgi:hypothetical protein